MHDLGLVSLTLFIALIGGIISYKLKLPAGAMLGAMALVIIYNLVTDAAFVPRDTRVVLQILAGLLLGSGIRKQDVMTLKSVIKPSLVLISGMVVLNFFFGFLMHRVGGLDLATALFATAPGGLTDMALIADEIGADMLQVSSLQLFRILFIFATLPALFVRITRKRTSQLSHGRKKTNLQSLARSGPAKAVIHEEKPATSSRCNFRLFFYTLLAAAGGGLLLWWLGINAGALIGSMLAVACLNVCTDKATCPKNLRFGVQCAAGAFIGQTLNRESVAALEALLIPMLIMVVSVLTFTFVVSFFMQRLTRMNPVTSLIASAPGGLQEMALLAEDMQADPAKVVVLQTTRLMTVIIFFPTILTTAARLFG